MFPAMNRSALIRILLSTAAFAVARGEEQSPATPLDFSEVYCVAQVVAEGDEGAREIELHKQAIHVSKVPLLTLRDIETIDFGKVRVADPQSQARRSSFTGRLTFSEWGARRRARAEGENKGGQLATIQAGKVIEVWKVLGRHIGRSGFFSPAFTPFRRRPAWTTPR